MKKAIYAFSGDPITFGHIDIIQRATLAFDELIVAIGNNPAKKCHFSLEKRTQLATEALKQYNNVHVTSFVGMLTDFAYEQGVHYIVRGLRNSEDFNYELMLYQIGQSQKMGIDTFFLPCSQSLSHISSGAAKAIQLEQGFIHEYVPLNVKKALEKLVSQQEIIGITGPIGAGKSYFCTQQVNKHHNKGEEAHHIDLDKVVHEIMESLEEPVYLEYRKNIIKEFGQEIVSTNGFINRKALGKLVFHAPEKLQLLNKLTETPLLTRLRKKLHGLKGKIYLEGALLIEAGLTYLCNNEIILLDVDSNTQRERLKARNYSENQIKNRINSQYSFEQKVKTIEAIIERDGFGKMEVIKG